MTVIADAVTEFEPDHILIALRIPEHANWQERRLIEHVENRFRLPVTTFAVDLDGHTPPADGPLLLCYDGSEDAKHAIEQAGRLLGGRDALVVTVWQPTPDLGSSAFDSTFDFAEINGALAEQCGRVAGEGVRIAEGRDCTPSRPPSRPPAPCGKRSSTSLSATTQPPSSWAPAD